MSGTFPLLSQNWLSNLDANKYKRSYLINYADVWGDFIVRRHGVNVTDGFISLNGNLSLSGSVNELYSLSPENTAYGYKSLYNISMGNYNTAFGSWSLYNTVNGNYNTAVGYYSGYNNVNGTYNTFIGKNTSLSSGSGFNYSTAIGYDSKITGSNKIFLGTSKEDVYIPGYGDTNPTNNNIISLSSSQNGLTINSNGNIIFSNSSGKEYLRITSTGNIGINNQNPLYSLVVDCSSNFNCSPIMKGDNIYSGTYNDSSYNIGVGVGSLSQFNFNSGGIRNFAIGYNSMNKLINDSSNNNAFGYYSLSQVVSSIYNNAFGYRSISNLNIGNYNNAFGWSTLIYTQNTVKYCNAFGSNAMITNREGIYNNAFGSNALYSNITGSYNNVFGMSSNYNNRTGSNNNVFGYQASFSNTTGGNIIAFGYQSLFNNTNGNNIAFGYQSLLSNTTSGNNIAFGYQSLLNNTTIGNNIAFGYQSLLNNTAGLNNIAIGSRPLKQVTTGSNNIAFGTATMGLNTSGSNNIAFGSNSSLWANTTGSNNIALGALTLNTNSTGGNNIAIGFRALSIGNIYVGNVIPDYSIGIGVGTGTMNVGDSIRKNANIILIGNNTDLSGSNSTTFTNSMAIGYGAKIFDSNQISIGVFGNAATGTNTELSFTGGNVIVPGYVWVDGSIYVSGTVVTSDYRIKKNVRHMDETISIDKLKPINYYNNIMNSEEYGFLAHEVGEVFPNLVFGKKNDDILQYVNYNGITAININEIKILNETIDLLQKEMEVLDEQIRELGI